MTTVAETWISEKTQAMIWVGKNVLERSEVPLRSCMSDLFPPVCPGQALSYPCRDSLGDADVAELWKVRPWT